MISRHPLRLFFRWLLLPVDLAAALILATFLGPAILFIPKSKRVRRLISFVPGMTVALAQEKFGGTYKEIFFEDLARGFFEEVTLFFYPMPSIRARHEWTNPCGPGERVVVLERTPPLGVFYAVGLVWLIAEAGCLGRRQGVSLVRGRDPYLYAAMAWAAAKLIGVPFVFSVHTDYDLLFSSDPRHRMVIPMQRRLISAVARFVLPRAALAMPIRESIMAFLLRHGVRRDRVVVIPHGVDLAPYDRPMENPRPKFGIDPARRLVVSVGRVTVDNYFHHLPDIAEIVRQKFPDALFVAAGPGWDLQRMRDATRGRALESHLKWLGEVDHRDVMALWREASVALVMKGGYSLIEACVTACAVVSYNIEWHYELVLDGKTGFLVPVDPKAAADAICKLLGDDPLRRQMAESMKSHARGRHSTDVAVAARRAAYDRALKS